MSRFGHYVCGCQAYYWLMLSLWVSSLFMLMGVKLVDVKFMCVKYVDVKLMDVKLFYVMLMDVKLFDVMLMGVNHVDI